MNYDMFQDMCMGHGFLVTPITKMQYDRCVASGVDPYPVACDVAAGATFADALANNDVP